MEENKEATKWDRDNVQNIRTNDSNYLFAIKVTQESLPVFLSAFEARDKNLSFFIKSKFTQNEHSEHMWLRLINHKADSLVCVLDNVPNKINSVRRGDTLIIQNTEVEDVVIYDSDTLLFGDFINRRNK